MKTIQPPNTKTIGPYSPEIRSSYLIFCSGQIGINNNGKIVSSDIKDQCQQALDNLKTVLKTAGVTPQQVVKTTIFFTNINDYAQINDIYANFFKPHKPARSTMAVADLPKQAKIEIEAIAAI